jgi:urease accessory protein
MDLPLAVWMSPMFPVGGFAYSHGLEWAHEAGDLPDADALLDWLSTLLASGAPRNDALVLAEAYRAAAAQDRDKLGHVAELALALATSRERLLETASQGQAFVRAIRNSWPCPALDLLAPGAQSEVAYPVAIGVAAAGHAMPLRASLEMFLVGFMSNLVSAAIKLGIIGQTGGQTIIAALLPPIRDLALFALSATLDDLGACCVRSDIASLRHETQYTRLFRS